MAEIANCYATHRDHLGRGASDWFFREPVNNARLVPFAAYYELVAGLRDCLPKRTSLADVFSRADAMKHIDADARVAELNRLGSLHRPRPTEATSSRIGCQSLEYDDAD